MNAIDTFEKLKEIELPYFTEECTDHQLSIAGEQIRKHYTWFYKWMAEETETPESDRATTAENYYEFGELMAIMVQTRAHGITAGADTEDRLTYRAYAHWKGINTIAGLDNPDPSFSDAYVMNYYISQFEKIEADIANRVAAMKLELGE